MKEYIEREEALIIAKILVHIAYTRTEKTKDTEIEKAINAIPAADVRPVIRGEWIKQEPYNQNYWKCSNCGETNKYAYRDGDVTIYELQDFFCPNCGADMRGEENDAAD